MLTLLLSITGKVDMEVVKLILLAMSRFSNSTTMNVAGNHT